MLLVMPIIRKLKKKKECARSFTLIFGVFSYMPPQGYPPYGGGYPDEHYGSNRNRAGGYNPSYPPSGPVTTTQVTVPTEMAGKRIGFFWFNKRN